MESNNGDQDLEKIRGREDSIAFDRDLLSMLCGVVMFLSFGAYYYVYSYSKSPMLMGVCVTVFCAAVVGLLLIYRWWKKENAKLHRSRK